MLVPGTENNRYFCTFFRLQSIHKGCNSIEPTYKFRMMYTTWQYGSYNRRITHIPRIFAGQGVIEMPAKRNHSSPFILINRLLTYFAKRHVIQTFLSFQFNVTQIERHDSRIITTHTFHVTAIFVTFPADTVKRIVMMTKHNPLGGNLPFSFRKVNRHPILPIAVHL